MDMDSDKSRYRYRKRALDNVDKILNALWKELNMFYFLSRNMLFQVDAFHFCS